MKTGLQRRIKQAEKAAATRGAVRRAVTLADFYSSISEDQISALFTPQIGVETGVAKFLGRTP